MTRNDSHCRQCGHTLSDEQIARNKRLDYWGNWFTFGGTAVFIISIVLWTTFIHPENCVPGSFCLRLRHLVIGESKQ